MSVAPVATPEADATTAYTVAGQVYDVAQSVVLQLPKNNDGRVRKPRMDSHGVSIDPDSTAKVLQPLCKIATEGRQPFCSHCVVFLAESEQAASAKARRSQSVSASSALDRLTDINATLPRISNPVCLPEALEVLTMLCLLARPLQLLH